MKINIPTCRHCLKPMEFVMEGKTCHLYACENKECVARHNSVEIPKTKLAALLANEEAREDERRKIITWGEGDCPHRTMANLDGDGDVSLRKRSECPLCWQALREGKSTEGG